MPYEVFLQGGFNLTTSLTLMRTETDVTTVAQKCQLQRDVSDTKPR